MKALREPVSLRYDHDHGPDGRTPYDHPDCAGCLGERAARLLRDHDQRLLPALVLAILAHPALPSEELRERIEQIADRLAELRETSSIEGRPDWTSGSRAAFALAEGKLRALLSAAR